ncbi:E3 ubiquitin-protein ligase RNF4-like isoform X1 [Periplaneta americana]|uniref:E3 ubiquitin-protein ligase RNF4-like isoform X1 n=1 Tax=Periplaneta americana TaxID=6978 RepID=UPI0037E95F0D
MTSRSERAGRSKCKSPSVSLIPDFIVDLTIDSPPNEVAPTQLGDARPRRRPRAVSRNESIIVLDDVIDLSSPSNSKKAEKRSRLVNQQLEKRAYTAEAEEAEASSTSPQKKLDHEVVEAGICPICLEKLQFIDPLPKKQVMSTQCGHMYCRSCITSFFKHKNFCPKCRRKQTLRDIHPLFV